MIKYYLIDPPEGHKYGFPKMMSEEDYKNQHLKSLSQWCIDNGYPKEVVEEYGDVFFIKSTGSSYSILCASNSCSRRIGCNPKI